MTTGRINQVANPLFVLLRGPAGGPASSRTPEKRRARVGEGFRPDRLAEETWGRVGLSLSPATAAFRWWCWGREVPSHTPRACGCLRAYWVPSWWGRGLSVRLGPGLVLGRTGRPTHWASSSLLVESVR